jgi:hypothetical protein
MVARSDRHGAGRKPRRAVAEIDVRARDASADRVRGRGAMADNAKPYHAK